MTSRKLTGVTLLETMLALVVATTIVVFSIRQYEGYKEEQDIQTVKNHVTDLFNAMNRYYQINCGSKGSPFSLGVGSESLPVDIEKDLAQTNLITSWPFIKNDIVKGNKAGESYVAQFNKREVSMPDRSIGSVIVWQSQVAIEIRHPKLIKRYLSILEPTCIADTPNITVCPDTPGKKYFIFQSLPGAKVSSYSSNLWPMMQTTLQFKQMYTVFPILMRRNKEVTQNFMCGVGEAQ